MKHYNIEYLIKYNNRNVSRHERQAKYDLCKALGFAVGNSVRMRDWTLSHIAQISATRIYHEGKCLCQVENMAS